MNRAPFHKSITKISWEEAHGGTGRRRMLLSGRDAISTYLEAMTQGVLPAGGVFDWHSHVCLDEYFIVLQGGGEIEFEGGKAYSYKPEDLVYIPAGVKHRIVSSEDKESWFYFIRISADPNER